MKILILGAAFVITGCYRYVVRTVPCPPPDRPSRSAIGWQRTDEAGLVRGHVLTVTGRPLRGATVRLLPSGLTARTDENGQFAIPSVPLGEVIVEVGAAPGPRVRHTVLVGPGSGVMLLASMEERRTVLDGCDYDVMKVRVRRFFAPKPRIFAPVVSKRWKPATCDPDDELCLGRRVDSLLAWMWDTPGSVTTGIGMGYAFDMDDSLLAELNTHGMRAAHRLVDCFSDTRLSRTTYPDRDDNRTRRRATRGALCHLALVTTDVFQAHFEPRNDSLFTALARLHGCDDEIDICPAPEWDATPAEMLKSQAVWRAYLAAVGRRPPRALRTGFLPPRRIGDRSPRSPTAEHVAPTCCSTGRDARHIP